MKNAKLVQALDTALQKATEARKKSDAVHVEVGGIAVRAELQDVDRLGVVVDQLTVTGKEGDLNARSSALRLLRPNGERLHEVEVAPSLGGSRLRTQSEDIQNGEFFEVGLEQNKVEVHRYRKNDAGSRSRESFTLTRKHLGELVDDIANVLKS